MNRRCYWGCLLLLGSACGAAPSPSAGVAPVTSAAGDSSATPAAIASSAAAPAQPVGQLEGRIVTVAESKESGYKRVKIEFRNTTSRPCSILGYEIQWPGGKKPAKLEGVVLPPGESRERWLRVDHHDGDVGSLSEAATKLTLESDCTVSKP